MESKVIENLLTGASEAIKLALMENLRGNLDEERNKLLVANYHVSLATFEMLHLLRQQLCPHRFVLDATGRQAVVAGEFDDTTRVRYVCVECGKVMSEDGPAFDGEPAETVDIEKEE